MFRKVLCVQYSDTNIGGKFDFTVNNENIIVKIKSSKLEDNEFLNISFDYNIQSVVPFYKIEILNANDETVFFFLNLYNPWNADISNFCNLTALRMANENLISRKNEDSTIIPEHIKIALSFGTREELLQPSSVTNIDNLSPIQMLRSILNETAFDDPHIESEAIGTLIESSVDRLRRVIKVENAANILRLAQKYNVESLKEVAVKFVAENFGDVMETSGWKEMPDRLSKELLSTILLSTNTGKKVKLDQD